MSSHEATLTALARGLAEGAELQVAFHDSQWAWDPESRTLTVGRRDLDDLSLAECAALIAHEVGHCAISRYLQWHAQLRPAELPGWLWRDLLNVLEDPRVEGWMIREFPGAGAWFTALVPHAVGLCDAARPPTWSLRFLLGSLYEWQLRWTQPAPLTGPIAQALDSTRDLRRAYAEAWPQWQPVAGRDGRLHDSAWGIMALATQVGTQLVQLRAAEVDSVARRLDFWLEWLAVATEAVRLDNPSSCETVLTNLPELPVLPELPELDAPPPRPASVMVAVQLVRCVEQQIVRQNQQRMRGPSLGGRPEWAANLRQLLRQVARGRPPQALEPRQPSPTTAQQRNRLVAELRSGLLNLFPNERFPQWQRGFATGRRLDLRVALQLPADARRASELWQRRGKPEKPDAAVLLLVDLSGSMDHSGKVQAAVLATSVAAQVLSELEIRFAVVGFQDVPIPIVDFGEPWSRQLAQRIDAMVLEASATRPGGHNQPGINDDGPCLLAAARTLLGQPARTRLLLAISDGSPSGVRSGPEDLHRAVAQLTANRGLVLSAIGIGPDTGHVCDFYPDAQGDVPLERFAGVLSQTLVRRLAAGLKVAA